MDLQGPLKHSHSYSNRNPNLPLSKILYSLSSYSHRYIVIKDSLTAPLNRIGLIQRSKTQKQIHLKTSTWTQYVLLMESGIKTM